MHFETSVIFSLCQTRMACEFSRVHEALEFISGQSVWTHSIPRMLQALKPSLMQQFPWAYSDDAVVADQVIADAADAEVRGDVMAVINSEMNKLSAKYGATHEAKVIDDPTSVYKNPLAEAEEIFGDKVIVFDLGILSTFGASPCQIAIAAFLVNESIGTLSDKILHEWLNKEWGKEDLAELNAIVHEIGGGWPRAKLRELLDVLETSLNKEEVETLKKHYGVE